VLSVFISGQVFAFPIVGGVARLPYLLRFLRVSKGFCALFLISVYQR